jgi:hypothetical protein
LILPNAPCVACGSAFSSVPYEKGFNFLYYLQDLIGGEKPMNAFLKAHCERFKVTTALAKKRSSEPNIGLRSNIGLRV